MLQQNTQTKVVSSQKQSPIDLPRCFHTFSSLLNFPAFHFIIIIIAVAIVSLF